MSAHPSPTSVTAAPTSGSKRSQPPKLLHQKSSPKSTIPEMNIDKRVVDELLLICSVIGSSNADGEFVPVTDCLAWLQDLQRALRRDNDGYRPIGLLLGQWKVVKTKLLPLVMSCRYDRGVVLTVLKILVILTKPLSESAIKAGRQTIDVKSGKVDDSVIKEQIKLRENAIAQSDLLMEYKKMLVEHPSHRYAFQPKGKNVKLSEEEVEKEGGLLSIFTSLLAEPLSRTSRSTSDHLQIELVLHFVRNLLSIQPMTWSAEGKREHAKLSGELIVLLEKELMLEVLVCVGQEVEKRENEGYNLLLMEILSYLLKGQTPSDVAMSTIKNNKLTVILSPAAKSTKAKKNKSTRTILTSKAAATTSLRSHLQSEREKITMQASSRHSNFGGTLLVNALGKKGYVSATDYLIKPTQAPTSRHQPARRKNKKTEVFVGSTKSISSSLDCGPIGHKAKMALDSFCHKFVKQCYGPVMKSWKNEFRRDSNRLEDGDRTMFFKIVWFFHRWWRVCRENGMGENSDTKQDKSVAQNLIFTMDVFMFNLVLNSTDEYHEHKKPAELAETVALYAEMLNLLSAMYFSADSTERMMALGLMDRIFYTAEPLDRLPRLLSRWTAGTFGREYLVDLVECCHVAWKLLDVNAEKSAEVFLESGDKKRPKDAVERMNLTAYEFDKDAYFARKFVSNHIVFMYTQLLSQYSSNEAHVNRHVIAYFVRLCKFEIKSSDDLDYDDAIGKNELATKQSTYEPLLYNVAMFTAIETILNDTAVHDKEEFSAPLMFASSLMKRFARAAEANPMLFVEALFKHPIPHKFCEFTTNMYVSEELRMITVRDLLLADQKRYEIADKNNGAEKQASDTADVEEAAASSRYVDEEEEEVEFNGDDLEEGEYVPKKKRRKFRKKKQRVLESDAEDNAASNASEEEEEVESNNNLEGRSQQVDREGETQSYTSAALETEEPKPKAETPFEEKQVPKSSEKKRIRKTQTIEDDSDEEDFLAPIKVTRRTIFDDDDD